MTEEERLVRLLRSAFPPTNALEPTRDLWPSLVGWKRPPATWWWIDLGVASAVALTLLLFPDWFLFLAFHL